MCVLRIPLERRSVFFFWHILTHFLMFDSAAPATAHLRAATAYAQRLCHKYYRYTHKHSCYLCRCMRCGSKELLCADLRLQFLLILLLSSPLSYAYFVGTATSSKKNKMRRNKVVWWRNSISNIYLYSSRKFAYVQCVAKARAMCLCVAHTQLLTLGALLLT